MGPLSGNNGAASDTTGANHVDTHHPNEGFQVLSCIALAVAQAGFFGARPSLQRKVDGDFHGKRTKINLKTIQDEHLRLLERTNQASTFDTAHWFRLPLRC